MKQVFTLLIIISLATITACGKMSGKSNFSYLTMLKSAVSSLREGLQPQGQNPQMMASFRAHIAQKHADTTTVYYDIADMVVGHINEDAKPDFSMQYAASPNEDCLQCWEITQTFFLWENDTYKIIAELPSGTGAGGNGTYMRIDSILNGYIYRSLFTVEDGADIQSADHDVYRYENGKITLNTPQKSM